MGDARLPVGPRPCINARVLRRAMEAAGDRPGTLARRAGVASSAVSMALGGETVGPKTVAALAAALNLQPDDLITLQ